MLPLALCVLAASRLCVLSGAGSIQKEAGWYVSTCPELGVASQGKTRKVAYAMLAEAVELWLEAASAKEIMRRIKLGGSVQPLRLAHA